MTPKNSQELPSNLNLNTSTNLDPISLRFEDPDLEEKFYKFHLNNSLSILRWALFTSLALYALFGILDKYVSPVFYKEFFIIRFAIVIPLISLFLLFTYLPRFIKSWQTLMVIILSICALGIIYMLHRDPLNIYYYGGLFLIFMGGYFYIKLMFVLASITGFIIVILYNLCFFLMPQNANSTLLNLLTANAFFISSNIICMIGLYGSEKQERISFHSSILINQKKEQIERINNSLEEKVLARTKELKLALLKADESNKLKSAFLANMSHEIRTPMNGILGFTNLLNSPDLNPDLSKNYLEIINKCGNRMLHTVNSIIEVSKIDAGQLELKSTIFNICYDIQTIYDFFKPQAEAKKIDLNLKIDIDNKHKIISSDQDKVQSILTNLIKNALKYTDQGSVAINAKICNNILELMVSDTGLGIPKDRMNAIFNRFEQADINDSRALEGAGLGLSIVHSYVNILKGDIHVDSIERKSVDQESAGSIFTVQLPVIIEHLPVINPKTSVSNDHLAQKMSNLNILIAEDDDISFQYASNILDKISKTIIRATNGNSVLELIKENKNFDVVIMDIKMPLMDGFTATSLLKELKPNLPVIAVSAYAYPEDQHKAKLAGCDAYITKPYKNNDILSAISSFLPNKK